MYSLSGMAMASALVKVAAVFVFQLLASLASFLTATGGGGTRTGADIVKWVLAAVDTSMGLGAMLLGLIKPALPDLGLTAGTMGAVASAALFSMGAAGKVATLTGGVLAGGLALVAVFTAVLTGALAGAFASTLIGALAGALATGLEGALVGALTEVLIGALAEDLEDGATALPAALVDALGIGLAEAALFLPTGNLAAGWARKGDALALLTALAATLAFGMGLAGALFLATTLAASLAAAFPVGLAAGLPAALGAGLATALGKGLALGFTAALTGTLGAGLAMALVTGLEGLALLDAEAGLPAVLVAVLVLALTTGFFTMLTFFTGTFTACLLSVLAAL